MQYGIGVRLFRDWSLVSSQELGLPESSMMIQKDVCISRSHDLGHLLSPSRTVILDKDSQDRCPHQDRLIQRNRRLQWLVLECQWNAILPRQLATQMPVDCNLWYSASSHQSHLGPMSTVLMGKDKILQCNWSREGMRPTLGLYFLSFMGPGKGVP